MSVTGRLTVEFTDVPLRNGSHVVAMLRAVNGVGLTSYFVTLPVLIVTDTIVAGVVVDGWTPGVDIDYQPRRDAYSCRWVGFSDPHSPVTYRACLGARRGACDLVDFVDTGLVQGLDVEQNFSVPEGSRVFATVVGACCARTHPRVRISCICAMPFDVRKPLLTFV